MALTKASLRKLDERIAEYLSEVDRSRLEESGAVDIRVRFEKPRDPNTPLLIEDQSDRPLMPDGHDLVITFTEAKEGREVRDGEEPSEFDAIAATIEDVKNEPSTTDQGRKRVKFGTNHNRVGEAYVSRGHRDLTVPTGFDSVEMGR